MSCWNDRTKPLHCPYGGPGDRLWVRETFNRTDPGGLNGLYYYRADTGFPWGDAYIGIEAWKPSIFMPREASRITLEITDVRLERVQDISEADAIAEGLYKFSGRQLCGMPEVDTWDGRNFFYHPDTRAARFDYWNLWDKINAKRGFGWDKNPWVWVITFKRILQPEGGTRARACSHADTQ